MPNRKHLPVPLFLWGILLEVFTTVAVLFLQWTDDKRTVQTVFIVMTFVPRFVSWFFISWYLCGKELFSFWFCLDNLTVLGLSSVLGYSYLINDEEVNVLNVCTATAFAFLCLSLNGNYRCMMQRMEWCRWKLTLYDINRSFACLFYLGLGLQTLRSPPATLNKDLYLTYIFVNLGYLLEFHFTIARCSKADTFETSLEYFVTPQGEEAGGHGHGSPRPISLGESEIAMTMLPSEGEKH
jgi:hypothetical protein